MAELVQDKESTEKRSGSATAAVVSSGSGAEKHSRTFLDVRVQEGLFNNLRSFTSPCYLLAFKF